MVKFNKSPNGMIGNFIFGLATLLEGIIRVLSLGFLHGDHRFTPLSVARELARKHIQDMKKANHG